MQASNESVTMHKNARMTLLVLELKLGDLLALDPLRGAMGDDKVICIDGDVAMGGLGFAVLE